MSKPQARFDTPRDTWLLSPYAKPSQEHTWYQINHPIMLVFLDVSMCRTREALVDLSQVRMLLSQYARLNEPIYAKTTLLECIYMVEIIGLSQEESLGAKRLFLTLLLSLPHLVISDMFLRLVLGDPTPDRALVQALYAVPDQDLKQRVVMAAFCFRDNFSTHTRAWLGLSSDEDLLQSVSNPTISFIHLDPLMAAFLFDDSLMERLIHTGAYNLDVMFQDTPYEQLNGKRLIHLVVHRRSRHLLKTLLRAGANMNSQTTGGAAALHAALVPKRPSITIIRILLFHGADPKQYWKRYVSDVFICGWRGVVLSNGSYETLHTNTDTPGRVTCQLSRPSLKKEDTTFIAVFVCYM